MKSNELINTNSVLVTEEKVPKCYKPENFTHNSIFMHPGILGWKVLLSKEQKIEYINIPSKLGVKKIILKDFPPQTLIHRSKYLITNSFYNYENNILKKIINKKPIVKDFINLIYYFSLFLFSILPISMFIYFFKK